MTLSIEAHVFSSLFKPKDSQYGEMHREDTATDSDWLKCSRLFLMFIRTFISLRLDHVTDLDVVLILSPRKTTEILVVEE